MNSVDQAAASVQFHGQLKEEASRDWMEIFAPLYKKGYRWDAKTGTLKMPGYDTADFLSAETPWIHVKTSPLKDCLFDHHVAFDCFGIIPPKCLECWKVVVTPKSYHQLRQMEELEESCPYSCKLGIEVRDYTPKHYGCYFYNDSIDAGRECYETIRTMVNKHIDGGDELDVILKRGCTEFEFLKGPSPFWTMSVEEEKKYELLRSFVGHQKNNNPQPELAKNHIRLRWAQWAHSNGDMSYKPYNDGKSLFPGYISYHEGDLDEIKQEIAMARATAKAKIKSEDSLEFQAIAQKFADEKGYPTPTMLIHALGAHEKNPLNVTKFVERIPVENVGEEDQKSG